MASSTVVLAVFAGALTAMKNAHGITSAQAAEYGGYEGGRYSKYGGDYKVLEPYPKYANKYYRGKYYGDYGYECGTYYPQYKWYKPFTWKFNKYAKTGYYVDCPEKPAEHVEETHEEPAKCVNEPPNTGSMFGSIYGTNMTFMTDVPKGETGNTTITVGPFDDLSPFDLKDFSGFSLMFKTLKCAWDLDNLREAKCTGVTTEDCEVLAKLAFSKLDNICVPQHLSLALVVSADIDNPFQTSDFEPCKAKAFAGKYTLVRGADGPTVTTVPDTPTVSSSTVPTSTVSTPPTVISSTVPTTPTTAPPP